MLVIIDQPAHAAILRDLIGERLDRGGYPSSTEYRYALARTWTDLYRAERDHLGYVTLPDDWEHLADSNLKTPDMVRLVARLRGELERREPAVGPDTEAMERIVGLAEWDLMLLEDQDQAVANVEALCRRLQESIANVIAAAAIRRQYEAQAVQA